MREIEWKVLSELMKNAKMSDREISKRIKRSQATVSRVRSKLEKQGYIREYVVIPDFAKLGYEIMAVTFVKLKKVLNKEDIRKARRISRDRIEESLKIGPFNVIMAERGMGLGYDGVFVSLHENYQSYVKHREWLGRFRFFEMTEVQTFLVDLNDKIRYFPLSFANLARHLLAKEGIEREGK
ncbi:MAG: winged helix-turn-helix transcriptional regulator [Candidatus Bathyarchaeota archaeon]|jgi:DNA-binding Lrp family transcriptional regulator